MSIRSLNIILAVGLMFPVFASAVPPKVKPQHSPTTSKTVDDAITANKKKDARRAHLAKEIAMHQATMDQYEKQNSFKLAKNKQTGITEAQYEAAKAARDRCQRERNELAN